MSKIDLDDFPSGIKWTIALVLLSLLIFVAEELSEDIRKNSGDGSYAHNASKKGVESVEILDEGANIAKKLEATEKPK